MSILRPVTSVVGARLVGTGSAVPDRVVTAAELGEPFGRDAGWVRSRTGIDELRRLGPAEALESLAVRAGRAALADAGRAGIEIDTLLVATCSQPPGAEPLSSRIAAGLTPRAAAFDVNAACAGFCYALSVADSLIATGSARTVLLIGAEQMSQLVDPDDLGTAILFADGAGAAVLAAEPAPGGRPDARPAIGPPAWSSDGARSELLEIPTGQRHLRMNGRQVFRWAVEEVHRVARAACDRAGLSLSDIGVFVPHQANLRIVDAIVRRLGLDHAITATDVTVSGNTSAASIPIALDRLRRTGRVRSGQYALLTGFGAGLSVAAQVIQLP